MKKMAKSRLICKIEEKTRVMSIIEEEVHNINYIVFHLVDTKTNENIIMRKPIKREE